MADTSSAAKENGSDTKQEIRAVQLAGFGGLQKIKTVKVTAPKPGEGEVLIKVKACGVNFHDLVVRQGAIDSTPKTPFTMGFECAGEIEALGDGVKRFEIGDRVLGFTDYGAWGESAVCHAQFVYKIPTSMSFHDAAALFMNYVTAYILLFDIGNVKRGQSVLVHGVGGGVGTAIIQLVKMVGDVTLFGTATETKHEAIRKHVAHVFSHTQDYPTEIKKISPDGVDVVLDCLCGEDTNRGINLLKPLGKYVLYGSANMVTGETKSFFSFAKSWWQIDKISPVKLYEENKSIAGFNLRQLCFRQGRHEYVKSIIHQLFSWYNDGKVKPVIDSTWAFEQVTEAMQKMHDRQNIGKLILDVSQKLPEELESKTKEVKISENANTEHEGDIDLK